MQHKRTGRKFGRKSDQRKAFFNSLARALFLKERITTVEARAKEIRSLVEKSITRAKKADISSKRLLSKSFSDNVVKKLINEIAPRYKEKQGGYTRIIKLGQRKGDGAKMAIIELIK